MNEKIEFTVDGSDPNGVYYVPASVMIIDDDPDIMLSLSQDEVNEADGTVTVTITAEADEPVNGQVVLNLAPATTSTATTGGSTPDIPPIPLP